MPCCQLAYGQRCDVRLYLLASRQLHINTRTLISTLIALLTWGRRLSEVLLEVVKHHSFANHVQHETDAKTRSLSTALLQPTSTYACVVISI